MARRDYAGGAVATTLAGSITASSLTINLTSSTGWPSGGNGPFFVVINRGESTEEKILVTSRSAETLTVGAVGDRGADGTSAGSHNPGEAVEHCFTAIDADEANAHINNTGLDHHTQYLNNARHDIAARHTFGAGLGTPGAAADVGTVPSAGVGAVPAREDHVHQLGAGSIDASAMFAASVVDAAALADNAVDTAAIVDSAVTLAKMADNSVGTVELVADSVTSAKIADGAIDNLAFFLANLLTVAYKGEAAALSGTTSTTYVDWPTGNPFSLAHTKKIAGSQILLVWLGSAWISAGVGLTEYAVKVDVGTDTKIGQFYFNTLAEHHVTVGVALLPGIAAGAHTYNLRAKTDAGITLQADIDMNHFIILELP